MSSLAGQKQIGVVVIGRNEGERLIRCLESLSKSATCLVYVDSASTDGSREAALERGAVVVELDLSQPFSMARARNAGFARVCENMPQVELIQFVDGDCEVVDGWMDTAVAALDAHPDTAVVCGRRRERYPENSVYNRMCDIEWNSPTGEAAASGGDTLIRADVLRQVGGFNEELIAGEEPEMCIRIRKIGWKIRRLDAEMTLHDANILHFSEWWKRNIRCGYGSMDVVIRLDGTCPEERFYHITKSAVSWTRNWLIVTILLAALGGILLGTLGAFMGIAAGLGLVVVQGLRIARGVRPRATSMTDAVVYGMYTMLGKWAQAKGQRKCIQDRKNQKAATIIEYNQTRSRT